MDTAYLGTSAFAAAILEVLAESPHRPTLVVSRPDRPRGRGRVMQPPPVIDTARALGIPTLQPDSVNDPEARSSIAEHSPQRLVVCAFGALIKEPLLSEYGPILNVHPSLLPRWRGAAPIERAILAGDSETGVSIMELTEGLDSGPVCLQHRDPIAADDDYGSLSGRLQQVGAQALLRALDGAAAGTLRAEPQDDADATYADKLTAEDRLLDPTHTAADLARRVRALSPHIGARLALAGDEYLGVWRAHALSLPPSGPDPLRISPISVGQNPPLDNFEALAGDDGRRLEIVQWGGIPATRCAEGWLVLDEVQPSGRKRMSGADWLRGLMR